MKAQKSLWENVIFILVLILAILFLAPIFIVFMNSFKGRFYISDTPFALPNSETFVGLENYTSGVIKVGFIPAFGYSLFITVFSVAAIVLFTAMTAWCITPGRCSDSCGAGRCRCSGRGGSPCALW